MQKIDEIIDYRDYLRIIGRRGGKKGGKVKSAAKARASRANGKLGGYPKGRKRNKRS
jgi:hypothetical protein